MNHSANWYQKAQQFIPGGVNSPVRAFQGVGGSPRFIQSGQGAHLTDVDGKRYIDYVCSWGPLILGHAHPYVLSKLTEALANGLTFGASTTVEVALAEKITQCMPTIEQIRFVSSGTEAAMSAIRLARGFTKRDKIVKFAGCYHGHADSLLVAAGSGALTLGVPSSAGVPESVAQHTLVAEYNQLDQVEALFKQWGNDIAAIIVEPIAANMNLVLPLPGFLQGLRKLCDQYGALLIFDEVITGFRIGLGGASAHYQIKPDLTVLGKIVGGGLPAAAFGGRRDVMAMIAPLGPVYQAGTLSGNPLAMTAGLATLDVISQNDFYANLKNKTDVLVSGLTKAARAQSVTIQIKSIESLFGLFFTNHTRIQTEEDVKKGNIALFQTFFHAMLEAGVYLAPSAYEVGFVSAAHTEVDIQQTIHVAEQAFATVQTSIMQTEM